MPEQYDKYLRLNDESTKTIASCLSGKAFDELKKQPSRPLVDECIQNIEQEIRQGLERDGLPYLHKWYWPDAKKLAVCLTHDMDKCKETRRHILKIRNRFSRGTLVRSILGLINPYNNIERMIALEDSLGFRSTFFVMTTTYDLHKLRLTLHKLEGGLWEIGLHGDLDSNEKLEPLKAQTKDLQSFLKTKVRGVRQHYLRFSYPETWQIEDEAGYVYDSTVGFRDETGFRVGTSFPYHPPARDWSRLSILELPLILMDTTLWGYKKMTEQEGLETFRQLLSTVEKANGLFTILWHQCALLMRGGRIYSQILRELKSKEDAFITNAIKIAEWWQRRSNAHLSVDMSRTKIVRVEGKDLTGLAIRIVGAEVARKPGTIKLVRVNGAQFAICLRGTQAELALV